MAFVQVLSSRTALLTLLLVAVAAGLLLARPSVDSAASSAGTEIFITTSLVDPSPAKSIFLATDADPLDLYVYATNVKDPQGLGSFQVRLVYDGVLLTVTALDEDTTWLGETMRTVSCTPPFWAGGKPYVRPIPGDPDGLWEGLLSCGTLGAPPPIGPQGDGLLATMTISPKLLAGTTTLDLSDGTFLLDTGVVVGGTVFPPEVIPATVYSTQVTVATATDDDDDDGCINGKELGTNAALGGLRDHTNFWDFFDVWTPDSQSPGQYVRDKAVTIDDIQEVAKRFLTIGTDTTVADALTPPTSPFAYHASYDVGAQIGANFWNVGPASGDISIDDVAAVASQFLHSC